MKFIRLLMASKPDPRAQEALAAHRLGYTVNRWWPTKSSPRRGASGEQTQREEPR